MCQVWNRLYAESQTNADVHQLWAELKKNEEVQGCTFKPVVNHNVEAPAIRAQDDSVWEWLAKPKQKPEPYKDPQATFKPKVGTVQGCMGRENTHAALQVVRPCVCCVCVLCASVGVQVYALHVF